MRIRSLIFAAVVDCRALAGTISGRGELRPSAFVSLFLTKPVIDNKIKAEIVDVSGEFGHGTLDLFVREEPGLVR